MLGARNTSVDWGALKILDALPDLVYAKDTRGIHVFANSAYCDFLSLPKESVIGKTDAELLSPSLADACLASDELALQKGAPIEVEERETANGRERFFETIKAPIMLDGGVVAILGISRDITHYKMIERRLAESEEKYRLLIEMCPDAIFHVSPTGEILLANNRAAAITGFGDPSKIIGASVFDLVSGNDAQRIRELADRAFAAGQSAFKSPISFEVELKRQGGSTFEASISASAIEDGSGSRSIIGLVRDITLLKKAKAELVSYSKELERTVEERTAQLREKERLAAIGETATMVGHDLRNPLQAIVNAFYICEMEMKRAPREFQETAKMMGLPAVSETIRRQLAYMEKIVSDLQDFARNMVPAPATSDLAQIITDSFPSEIPGNIKVVTDLRAKSIFADGNMLMRAVSNLVSNAIQAMPGGGTLKISTDREDGAVTISVSDTGCGIGANAMENLFKPLFTSKARGTGMGLVVVKKMVDLQGGTIHVESAVGNGTTFTIRLPDKQN